jgi:hypothetical protein
MSTRQTVRFLSGILAMSVVAGIVFWLGNHEPNLCGPAGSIGLLSAVIGPLLSVWCAIRVRQWALFGTVVLSLPPAAIWLWVFYVHLLYGVRQ